MSWLRKLQNMPEERKPVVVTAATAITMLLFLGVWIGFSALFSGGAEQAVPTRAQPTPQLEGEQATAATEKEKSWWEKLRARLFNLSEEGKPPGSEDISRTEEEGNGQPAVKGQVTAPYIPPSQPVFPLPQPRPPISAPR
jgi:hypothetical protein